MNSQMPTWHESGNQHRLNSPFPFGPAHTTIWSHNLKLVFILCQCMSSPADPACGSRVKSVAIKHIICWCCFVCMLLESWPYLPILTWFWPHMERMPILTTVCQGSWHSKDPNSVPWQRWSVSVGGVTMCDVDSAATALSPFRWR